jgi:hypothetical protein
VREDLACDPIEWKCPPPVEALETGCHGEMLEKRHATCDMQHAVWAPSANHGTNPVRNRIATSHVPFNTKSNAWRERGGRLMQMLAFLQADVNEPIQNGGADRQSINCATTRKRRCIMADGGCNVLIRAFHSASQSFPPSRI